MLLENNACACFIIVVFQMLNLAIGNKYNNAGRVRPVKANVDLQSKKKKKDKDCKDKDSKEFHQTVKKKNQWKFRPNWLQL